MSLAKAMHLIISQLAFMEKYSIFFGGVLIYIWQEPSYKMTQKSIIEKKETELKLFMVPKLSSTNNVRGFSNKIIRLSKKPF